MREKLIKLLIDADLGCIEAQCHSCGHCDSPNKHNGIPGCVECRVADHLTQNGVTIQKWIPVTERLPEPFEAVLVYDHTGKRIAGAYLTRHREWVGVQLNHEVTHWMPLPEPPKEVE